jgi:D-amino-acid oxidase
MSESDIVIIGAGVIGLTSAVVLCEAGHRVRVLTAESTTETTSASAGAMWGPWLVEPRERVLAWAETTLTVLTQLAQVPGSGVHVRSGVDVSQVEHAPPDWAHLQPDRAPVTSAELPTGYTVGTRYRAPIVDMPVYLDYLAARLRTAGGMVEPRRLTTLHADDAEVVVNCSGMGAADLVPDSSMFPIRGYQIVVPNPGIKEFLEADTGDSPDLIAIYPHNDHLVLGGTANVGEWDRQPDVRVAEAILARCADLEPRLQGLPILEHRIGLRPTRPHVRLDLAHASHGPPVIHNYGHGGAGVSLAWGCAEEVSDLVRAAA